MRSWLHVPVLPLTYMSTQYEPNYDNIECAAAWARESLDKHRSDKREHLYTKCAASQHRAPDVKLRKATCAWQSTQMNAETEFIDDVSLI